MRSGNVREVREGLKERGREGMEREREGGNEGGREGMEGGREEGREGGIELRRMRGERSDRFSYPPRESVM